MNGKYTLEELGIVADTFNEVRKVLDSLSSRPDMMVRYVCPHCRDYGTRHVRKSRKAGPCPLPCLSGLSPWIEETIQERIESRRELAKLADKRDKATEPGSKK